jgi:hypothetical protein
MTPSEIAVVKKAVERLYAKEPLEPGGNMLSPSLSDTAYAIGLLDALIEQGEDKE